MLIIFHNGFEELEAVAPVDILRRAGVDVVLAALGDSLEVTGRNGMTIRSEVLLSDCVPDDFRALVLPGGPGIQQHVRDSEAVRRWLNLASERCWLIGAICAAPVVLADAGLLEGRKFVSHPSVEAELPGAVASGSTVQDGLIVTSRGAGTAVEFGLHLAGVLASAEMSKLVADSICLPEALGHSPMALG